MSTLRRPSRTPHPIDVPAEQEPPRASIAERQLRLDDVTCRALSVRLPTSRRDEAARQALLRRIVSEFEEVPGMLLTVAQAARLFGLPLDACARMLADLADGGRLHQAVSGRYRLQAGPLDREAR